MPAQSDGRDYPTKKGAIHQDSASDSLTVFRLSSAGSRVLQRKPGSVVVELQDDGFQDTRIARLQHGKGIVEEMHLPVCLQTVPG